MVRTEGLVRIRDLDLPLLRRAAAPRSATVTDAWPVEVENLLRTAVSRLGGGPLEEAAALTLGLAPGMRDRPAADRRRLAAKAYSISVERFRKSQEEMILGQISEQICWLGGIGAGAEGASRQPSLLAPHLQHRSLRVGDIALTLHVHPVELVRHIDVIVSAVNTHLSLPEMFKASVPAALRRAAAVRDASGEVLADPVHEELVDWRRRNRVLSRPVPPGTVVPTGSGALAAQGVRRLYHAAVTVPRHGTNDYDVAPQDVSLATARVLTLLTEERAAFTPPLRSICFPLLGAGRGGLPPQTSVSALWAALRAGAAPDRDIHLVVRRPLLADLVTEVLGARPAPSAPRAFDDKETWHRCV
ncbi:macro domain-containing protein [Streptomyces sp. NPDC048208]|uniref:macro domain-containing protein n=1 Tax=Streptomyces sp. NPDC048208 TaxID=3365515 RepID=UPI00371A1765